MAKNLGSIKDHILPGLRARGDKFSALEFDLRVDWVSDCLELVAINKKTGAKYTEKPKSLQRQDVESGQYVPLFGETFTLFAHAALEKLT